ncbi:hypothetical protein NKDENANG_01352 [Candidatus Entotheonellaceae bacterium PAL068K]
MTEQVALYQTPEFRQAFVEERHSRKRDHRWNETRLLEAHKPALEPYVGRTIREIATPEGKQPVDVYLGADQANSAAA